MPETKGSLEEEVDLEDVDLEEGHLEKEGNSRRTTLTLMKAV